MVPFLETCECAYQTSAVQMLGTSRLAPTAFAPAPLYVIGAPAPTRAPPLPWAELGAKVNVAFALHAGRSGSEALLKTGATLTNVRALLSGVRASAPGAIVELATHGVTDPYDPRACYMLLAHNEVLSLAQLQREALLGGVRCCIAGGCFTGIGDLFTAPDEVSSFASGILQAGAASAIATLWGVSDRATFLLMRQLHTMLGMEASVRPAAALREAIRWLRGATREEIGTVVRKALTDMHSVGEGDLSRDAVRGLLLEVDGDEADENSEADSPLFAETEGGNRVATRVPASRAFINLDQEAIHPYDHPVYWAGFVIYGV
jgi:CHAT domain-containing protein